MTQNALSRIMQGAKTPEGKVIAVLLALCLALMTWNVAAISYAVSGDASEQATTKVATQSADETQEEKPKAEVVKESKAEKEAPAVQETQAEPEAPAKAEKAEETSEPAPAAETPKAEEPAQQQEEAPTPEQPAAETPSEAPQVESAAQSDDGQAPDSGQESATEEADQAEQQDQPAADATDAADAADAATDATAEADAADATEEPDEKAYPAQKFSATANGVVVKVEAPAGALPKGTTMSVTPVAAAQVVDAVEEALDAAAVQVKAVDITFADADGKTVEPKKNIKVTMAAAAIAAAGGNDEQDVAVVHVSDSGAADVVSQNATASAANAVAFTSSDFSIYAIVVIDNPDAGTGDEGDEGGEGGAQEGEEAVVIATDDQDETTKTSYRTTYKFYLTDADGATSEYWVNGAPATQIVKEGDTLMAPEVPKLAAHQEFTGWYVKDTHEAVSFGTVGEVERNSTVEVVGDIDTVYYAKLMNGRVNESAEWPLLTTVKATAAKGESYAIANVGGAAAASANDDEVFLGWTLTEGSNTVELESGADLRLTDDVTLYPVFGRAYWLYFDENDGGVGGGASYTAPQYVLYGTAPTKPADPERAGYTFDGWYTEPEGGNLYVFDANTRLEAKTTVYAHWTRAQASYTVIFWQQKVTDDKACPDAQKTYDYKESVQRSAYTDDVVKPTSDDTVKSYTGFHYNSANSDTQATVKADGSTVINVRYDRDLITMSFAGLGEATYTYTATGDDGSNLYGYVGGEYVKLDVQTTTEQGAWTYKARSFWSTYTYEYEGAIYEKSGSGRNATYKQVTDTSSTSKTYYGYVQGSYVELSRATTTVYAYSYNGEAYGGTRYERSSSTTKALVVSGLYGQSLGMYGYSWPEGVWSYKKGNTTTYMSYLGQFVLPDAGSTAVSFDSVSVSAMRTIYFYLQNEDGTWPDSYSDRGFTNNAGTSTFNFTEKYNGYKVVAYQLGNDGSGTTGTWTDTKSGGSVSVSGNLGIRYARAGYTIDFQNGAAGSIGTVGKQFEESLADVAAPRTPTYPGNASEAAQHEFIGWFSDPECTTYVSFGSGVSAERKAELQTDWGVKAFTTYEAMPSNNLVVYAGWMKKWFNVTLDANGGTLPQGASDNFWVQYGDKVAGSSLMQASREGYALVGWCVDEDDGTPWNFDTGVASTLHLVAKWASEDDVTVAYDAGAGQETSTDATRYTDGALVTVGSAPEPPEGKVFVGWRLMKTDATTAGIYYPGDTFQIKSSCIAKGESGSYVQLVAEYVTYDVTTEITYSANGGQGTVPAQTLPVNATSKLSDGQTLSREGYTLVGWSLTSGDSNRVNFKLGGSIAADKVGEEKNTLYAVWAQDVTITATGATGVQFDYDGTRHVNDEPAMGYAVGGQAADALPAGISYEVFGLAAGMAAGTYADDLRIEVGAYDTNRYHVTTQVENGQMKVNKTAVTVKVAGNVSNAAYDGQAHTVEGYTVQADSAAFDAGNDLVFAGEAKASGTDAGTYAMGLAPEQFSLASTSNFTLKEVQVEDGRMTIAPAKVKVGITGAVDAVTYNGAEQSVQGYTASIGNALYTEADFSYKGQATASGTDAGTYAMNLDAADFVNDNANFDPEFQIVADGRLDIAASADEVIVTIVGATLEQTYDGAPHTASGYEFRASNPAYTQDDFTFAGTAEATTTDAGKQVMGLAAEQFENANSNFANVTFNVTDGFVEVARAKATVRIEGARPEPVTYDRQEHEAAGYTVTCDNPVFDIEADLAATVSAADARVAKTDAGTYAMGLAQSMFSNNNARNVDVAFEVIDGQLVISPVTDKVTVNVQGAKAQVAYDKLPHTADGFSATANNELYRAWAGEDGAADFRLDGVACARGTDAGEYAMNLSPTAFINLNPNFANVEFQVADGMLQISKAEAVVHVAGHSHSYTYNGAEQAVEGFDVTIEGELYTEDDYQFNGAAAARGTDAGRYDMGLSREQFTNVNENFDVRFIVDDGVLAIDPVDEPVHVSIVGNTATYTYDGASHEASGYAAQSDNSLYTQANFVFTGNASASGTTAGSYAMGLDASQFQNASSNFNNVMFEVTDGALQIDKLDVTVSIVGNTATSAYDGQEHGVMGYTMTASSALYTTADFEFAGEASAARTDVGTTEMDLAPEQFANVNPNFGTVTFQVTDGYQQVTPADEVVVTVAGTRDTVPFDAQKHQVTGYTVAISDPLYTEADFTFAGNAQAAGTYAGTYAMNLSPDQFENVNPNFDKVTFVVEDGTLTIAPIPVVVTITGNKATYGFDASEHAVRGYTATADVNEGLPEGATPIFNTALNVRYQGEAAAAGTYAGTYPMGLDAQDFTCEDANNFSKVTFQVTDGFVKIDPVAVKVTITGATSTLPYDGVEHVASGYMAEADVNAGQPAGAVPVFNLNNIQFEGASEAARTDAGTTWMGLDASQFSSSDTHNFSSVTFQVADGYQTIEPIDVAVSVTGQANVAAFDGAEHAVSGYDLSFGNALYTEADFEFTGVAQAARTDAGRTPMNLSASQFVNRNPNFGTVTFDVTDGYQQIDPIDAVVHVAGTVQTLAYDGASHTASGYVATADVNTAADPEAGTAARVLLDVANDIVFSGSATASRTKAGTTRMGLASEQFACANPNFGTVTFDVVDGYVRIVPVDEVVVTITGATESAVYDGAEHAAAGYTVQSSNPLYTAEQISFTPAADADVAEDGQVRAARTDAGRTPMGLAPEQFANLDEQDFANVTFVVADGWVEVARAQATVTITGDQPAAVTYDRQRHEARGYTAQSSNAVFDVERDLVTRVAPDDAVASGIDAGTYAMGLQESCFGNANAANVDVTFVVIDGQLVVNPVSETVVVTVSGHASTVTYNGVEQGVSGFDIVASNPLYATGASSEGDGEDGAAPVDFTYAGAAAAKGTDAGTYAMGLSKKAFQNVNDNFENVVFKVADGGLTVVPAQVTATITGATATRPYNGARQEVESFAFSASNPLYTAADYVLDGQALAAGTNVRPAKYFMGLSSERFENANPNFDVTFEVEDGWLVIEPIDVNVTITGAFDTAPYDGQLHEVSGYAFAADNPLYTEADFAFSGSAQASRTDEGVTDMGLDAAQFANVSANFGTVTFNVTDGYQAITAADGVVVTVTGRTATATYDGREHAASGFDVQISNPLYTADDFEFTGTARAARTDAGMTPMGLAPEQFQNTSANFQNVVFQVVDGSQTVTPLAVTVDIVGRSLTTSYDGQLHEVSGYAASASTPLYRVAGDELDFAFSGDATCELGRTNAGTDVMGLASSQFSNVNANFGPVTFNVTDGQLTVLPVDVRVNIVGAQSTLDFDGVEHAVSGYEVRSGSALYGADDFAFTGNAQAARTNAGTTKMGLAPEQFVNTSPNFANVTFDVVDGWQAIAPINATVRIVGNTLTASYDASEHEVWGYTAAASVNVAADEEAGVEARTLLDTVNDIAFAGEARAARTDAGTTPMGLASEQFSCTNPNFADVTFTVTDGGVTVAPAGEVVVSVTGRNLTAVYDGSEHAVEGYDVQISDPLYTEADFAFSGEAEAARTDAGTTAMGLAASQFSNVNPNFADVTFTVTDGFVEVAPASTVVTITGNALTATYTGAEHAVSGFAAASSNPAYRAAAVAADAEQGTPAQAADFAYEGEAAVKAVDAGVYDMGLDEDAFTNLNPNFDDVRFVVADGWLVITPAAVAVTVQGNTARVVYNGEEQQVEGYRVTFDNQLYDEANVAFSGDAVAVGTDAGAYAMGLAPEQFANASGNFAANFTVVDGGLQVEPADVSVSIAGHHDAVTYDGDEHGVEGFDFSASTPLYTADDFAFSGNAQAARTDEGTSYMGLAAGQFANVNPNFGKVTFTVADGYQTIVPVDEVVVTVTGHVDSATYDGARHTIEGFDVQTSNPLYTEADFTFAGQDSASATDAGTYAMGLAPQQFRNVNANFARVTFEVTDGSLTISPAPVTVAVTGATATDSYDATEHVASGFTATADNGLYRAAGAACDFAFTPGAQVQSAGGRPYVARTDAGTSHMGLDAGQFANVNPNFGPVTFVVEDGWQTVEPIDARVDIVGHAVEATYDGEAHEAGGFEVSIDEPLYTSADFAFAGEASVSRVNAGTYDMGLAATQFANVNPNFRTVTFDVVDGSLHIVRKAVEVTIAGRTASVAYTGDEQAVEGFDVISANDLYPASAVAFAGAARAAGTRAGTYAMGLSAGQFSNTDANFDVTFGVVDGALSIAPAEGVVVAVTGHMTAATYDGAEHVADGYDVQISDPRYTEADFSFEGEANATRADVGTTAMGLAVEQFQNTNPDFADVTFVVTDGMVKVGKASATVTVTGGVAGPFTYDGTEHESAGYEAVSSNPVFDVATDMGISEHAAGARVAATDAGAYAMGLGADDFWNLNADNVDVSFVVADGSLVIEPVSEPVTVQVEGETARAEFDGAEHVARGFTATADNELYRTQAQDDAAADFAYDGAATAKGRNAGAYAMGLVPEAFSNTNPNFANVQFVVVDGGLTIDPMPLVVDVIGNTAELPYNGAAQSVAGYSIHADQSLYDVASASCQDVALAQGTDAGMYAMGLSAEQFSNADANFDVTFNVTDGQLRIAPISATVVVAGHHDAATYDGAEHAVEGYDVQISEPLYTEADFAFAGAASAARTDEGTTPMGLAPEQFSNENANFDKVTFVVEDGWQTIVPVDEVLVTVMGRTGVATYDGAEHAVAGYDVQISDPLYTEADFAFSGEAAAAATDAGTVYMGMAAEQFQNTNRNFANVTFQVVDGYQTVTPATAVVDIVGATSTVAYDGAEHRAVGYEAESSTPLYGADSFVHTPGDGARLLAGQVAAVRTDAGTTYMGLASEQFQNTNPNFDGVVFNVVDGWQAVSPIAARVVVTGHRDAVAYDGTEHRVSGYDVRVETPLYAERDFTFAGQALAARMHQGTTGMNLAPEQFANVNPNFDAVEFVVEDGWQAIVPVDAVVVTITGHAAHAVYDGEEHAAAGFEFAASNPLYTADDFEFTPAEGAAQVEGAVGAARTDAGTTYMGLAAGQFTNVNDDFASVAFQVVDGYVQVDPADVAVTIAGHKGSATFDGAEHAVEGFDFAASNPLYATDDFAFAGDARAARTDVGTTAMGLGPQQFSNVNPNFGTVTFAVTDGWQAIVPVDEVLVTVTGHAGVAAYDGAEHAVAGYDVQISDPLYTEADFAFSGEAAAAATDAGTVYMGLSAEQFQNTNPNFANVAFQVIDGYQTVTPISAVVTVRGAIGVADYDGAEHVAEGYTAESNTPAYDVARNVVFAGKQCAARTDAGRSAMGLAPDQFVNADTRNFAQVTFVVTDGYQQIDPIDAQVTITGRSATATYDGAAHEVTGYDAKASTPLYDVANVRFDGAASARRTDAGTTAMGLDAAQFSNADPNFANVTFKVADGELTVEPLAVTVLVAGKADAVAYTAAEQAVEGFELSCASSLYDTADVTFSGQARAAGTEAGAYYMGLAAEQFANANSNFDVTFDVADGMLAIAPADGVAVTIVGNMLQAVYDRAEHEVSGYAVKTSDERYTEADFTFDGQARAVRTDAGTTAMGLDAAQFSNANPNFADVTFTVVDGAVSVTKAQANVLVEGARATATYDGAQHEVRGYSVTSSNAVFDPARDLGAQTAPDEARVAGADAGTYAMGLVAGDFRNLNADNVDVLVQVVDGELTIVPLGVEVDVAGATGQTTFNGQVQNVEGYQATCRNELYDIASVTFSGVAVASGFDAGTYAMGLAAGQFANTDANFDVTFAVQDGGLSIEPATARVTVQGHEQTAVYDGDEHAAEGYDAQVEGGLYTADDFTFDGVAETRAVNVGTYAMGLASEQFANVNPNFADVEFTVADGSLLIQKRQAELTSASDQKQYDGTPLVKHEVDEGEPGIVEGDVAGYLFTGSQTDVGESQNEFEPIATQSLRDNYDVAKVLGTLTVTEAPAPEVTPVQPDGSGEEAGLRTLTVNYVYAGGGRAAQSHVERLAAGTRYAVASPQVEGYTPNYRSVNGQMPDGDLVLTVVYTRTGSTPAAAPTVPMQPGASARTVVAPVTPATATTVAVPEAAAPTPASVAQDAAIVIDEDGTPLVESLEDEANALASGEPAGSWSLFDLAVTIIVVVLAAVLAIGLFRRNRDEEDDPAGDEGVEAAGATGAKTASDRSEDEPEDDGAQVKRRRMWRVAGVALAAVAVVLLLVTQDFTQAMALFDAWSVAFAIIGVLEIAAFLLSRRKKRDGDPDDQSTLPNVEKGSDPFFTFSCAEHARGGANRHV